MPISIASAAALFWNSIDPVLTGFFLAQVRSVSPKRLIDLKPSLDDSLDVRLVEVKSEIPEYVALSYCWGNSTGNEYKLTSENLESKMKRIAHGELPKTFQHVFSIVRSLGYRFIWIDALCILQDKDSEKDWIDESEKMGSIFGNAVFTIASNATDDPYKGLYNDRSSNLPIPDKVTVRTTLPDGTASSLMFFDSPSGYEAENTFGMMSGPVSQRGWTLQERMLSPRTLHYTSKQLVWECRETYETEDGSGSWDRWVPDTTMARMVKDISAGSLDQKGTRKRLTLWYRDIVPNYTERKVTVPSDKFPALSGLSRLLSSYLPGWTFLAGIWVPKLPCHDAFDLESLACGLLWYHDHSTTLTALNELRAPSFSWAALEGKVSYSTRLLLPPGYVDRLYCEIAKETNSMKADECDFPEGCCGSFIISYRFQGGAWGSCGGGDWNGLREEYGEMAFEIISFTNDLETKDTFGRVRSGTLTLRGYPQRGFAYDKSYILRNKQNEPVGHVFPDFDDIDSTQTLYFPLGSHGHVAYCLMLRLSGPESTNTYVRVGVGGLEIEELTWVSEKIVLI
ncbi:uncharacterized protein Z519_01075 [Cladophialophora bantiana CBS 173.52]|uniref:Heterokaryon incompatibility domain-containing protein n=1 Tax=Cladophialophora bantiana (strain ATCC 10958 / CBS 173.52 / CDC B-1940 / NIH 8579) TaxID=1442370 RepID=A0A0D2F5M3_CLAB1|nr:uncharacterized protein Z519_01075 [Cladophialophora bantiana CBS 173.52]KIW97491.1 hypothetical protein Z519_01075 [Cladophialophora bantiana CBS 173.52]